MRIFVTGGTGFIGSEVVKELITSKHQVLGLARSDKAARLLKEAGAEVISGTLDNLEVLKQGAASADGVIHLGFTNDFNNYDAAVEADLKAVEAIGSALVGTNKAFVIASGTLAISFLGRPATEEDEGIAGAPRMDAENRVIALSEKGVRSAVVRLAPCVHDTTRQGLASALTEIALNKGVSAYIGEGLNRWPAVHQLDAAHLFCRAVESAPAGTRFHATAEEGIYFKEIATAIGEKLKIPVVSISSEEANNHFGFFAQAASVDNPASSAITRKMLDWNPVHETLIQDIKGNLD